MTESHINDAGREKPSQGIFIGWLAIILLIVAVVVAGVGIYASSLHVL